MTSKADNQNDKVKITTPPNIPKEKVGSGGIPAENIKKAEQTLGSSAYKFKEVSEGDLQIISSAIADGKTGEKSGDQVLREVSAAAFELKANAGMFDYPLVTEIALSLFQLTDTVKELNDDVFHVLTLHYQAMRAAISMGGKAKNTQEAKELIKGLVAASGKVLK